MKQGKTTGAAMRRFAGMSVFAAVALGGAHRGFAVATTFTGTGDWGDPARWSAGVPGDGDEAIVAGTATNSGSTAFLNAYTLNAGATHVFTGTNTFLYATNVVVSGTLTHAPNTATASVDGVWYPDNRLQIVAASNVSVAAGGKIDVDGKGYRCRESANGYGPGGANTYSDGNINGGGSGHGGRGGFCWPQYETGPSGPVYGLASAPTEPGSGGSDSISKFGGGAVRIVAGGAVTVNGTITANGVIGISEHGASGASGGSVFITCATFGGTGGISANGGAWSQRGTNIGGGAGGRVAVVCTDEAAQSASVGVRFMVAGGQGGSTATLPDPFACYGDLGTLYLSGHKFLPAETMTGAYRLVVPSLTTWSPASLTVTNGWVCLPEDIEVTTTGGVTVGKGGTLELRGNAALNCGGDLDLADGGDLYVRAGPTNGVAPAYGALVAVTGDLTLGSGSVIYPFSCSTNGGSVLFTAANFTLAAGAMIDANIKGFRGGLASAGYGPGAGWYSSGGTGAGGSYGGKGGLNTENTVYGVTNAPDLPGSGGGAYTRGGKGGGLVCILCPSGQATIDGVIRANGGIANAHASGGGSGGGVHIACGTIAGRGQITADGGNGTGGGTYGGGGGGRIALAYNAAAAGTDLSYSLQGGTGSAVDTVGYPADGNGEVGTLYLADSSFFPSPVMGGCGRIVIPGLTVWAAPSLTITNGRVRFPDGCALTVTNDTTLADGGALDLRNHAVLECGGDLLLTNRAALHVYAGPTNEIAVDHGALVRVGGTFTVSPGCTAYLRSSPADGGSPFIDVGHLYVTTNGAVNATGGGYPAQGDAKPGLGPGFGQNAQGGNYGAGGGYGGRGGDATNGTVIALGGNPYGSYRRPLDPGSSGGNDRGDGGGLIRILARPYKGAVVIDGTLVADGRDGYSHGDGGGSGGGILVDCSIFRGTGTLSAKGGNMRGGGGGKGGGGGGRVAVWSSRNDWSGAPLEPAAAAKGGLGGGTYGFNGADGTVFLGMNATPGTVLLVR